MSTADLRKREYSDSTKQVTARLVRFLLTGLHLLNRGETEGEKFWEVIV